MENHSPYLSKKDKIQKILLAPTVGKYWNWLSGSQNSPRPTGQGLNKCGDPLNSKKAKTTFWGHPCYIGQFFNTILHEIDSKGKNWHPYNKTQNTQ